MGAFTRLRQLFSPQTRYVYGGDIGGDTGVRIATMTAARLYKTQPNLRAAVSFLADNAAQVPLKVYERAGDNDRPRVTDSPMALLLKQPNPDMTPFELRRCVYSDLLLYERFVAILVRSADTPSGWELRPVPNTWVQGYSGSSPFAPETIAVGAPGIAPIEVPADSFVLFHGYSPTDPMRQYSRIAALSETLHEQVESNAFRRQMWRRGGRFNAYITRPKDVQPWDDEGFERFKQTWRNSWAGGDASDAGGTPILEDGMEIRTVQFNSRDAQWADSVKLAREDVAAVYHFNPALLWPGSGQTYASARDNARALYNDCLAPVLMQVTDRLNMDVAPRIGEPSGNYVAYDITIKTQGTLEERIAALQTACGGPFMSRQEVRALMDLPAEPDGDLIIPLNVLTGGLASSHDTDPTRERYNSLTRALDDAERILGVKSADGAEVVSGPKAPEPPVVRKAKGDPSEEDEERVIAVYRAFFERQAKSVIPKIAAGGAWWNERRWNSELAADLWPVAASVADAAGERAVAKLWPDDPTRGYAKERTGKYIRSMCERRAEVVNAATKRQLDAAIAGAKSAKAYDDEDGYDEDYDVPLMSTPQGVFDNAEKNRSSTAGRAFAAALVGFGMLEACRQNVRRGENVFKVWRTRSGHPRSSHAAMDGEKVQYDEEFSNGMMWPGDMSANVSAAETANCRCATDLEKDEGDRSEREHAYGVRYEDAMEVDASLYRSREYSRKFNGISPRRRTDKKIRKAAKHALKRNSGKRTESMTLIDIFTGDSVTVDCNIEYGIVYNDKVKKFIADRAGGEPRIAAVHNHPNGTPPSLDDFSKAAENNYAFGVIVGHNGQVYTYRNYGMIFSEEECVSVSDSIYLQTRYFGRDIDRVCTEIYKERGLSYELR